MYEESSTHTEMQCWVVVVDCMAIKMHANFNALTLFTVTQPQVVTVLFCLLFSSYFLQCKLFHFQQHIKNSLSSENFHVFITLAEKPLK